MKNITKIFLILSLFSLNAHTICRQLMQREMEKLTIEAIEKSENKINQIKSIFQEQNPEKELSNVFKKMDALNQKNNNFHAVAICQDISFDSSKVDYYAETVLKKMKSIITEADIHKIDFRLKNKRKQSTTATVIIGLKRENTIFVLNITAELLNFIKSDISEIIKNHNETSSTIIDEAHKKLSERHPELAKQLDKKLIPTLATKVSFKQAAGLIKKLIDLLPKLTANAEIKIDNILLNNQDNQQFGLLGPIFELFGTQLGFVGFEKFINIVKESLSTNFDNINVISIPSQNTELSNRFETKAQIYNQEYFKLETNEEMQKLEILENTAKKLGSKLLFKAIENSLIVLNDLKKININREGHTLPGEIAGKIINFTGVKDLAGKRVYFKKPLVPSKANRPPLAELKRSLAMQRQTTKNKVSRLKEKYDNLANGLKNNNNSTYTKKK